MTGSKTSRLVIVHRYFWPQNLPYSQMLKHIAKSASQEKEFEVEVLTTFDSVDDKLVRANFSDNTGIHIHSIPASNGRSTSVFRKAIDALFFAIWVFFKLLRIRPNIVMVATTPPIIMGLVVRLAAKVTKFNYIYHCQDIHPEAMKLNKNIKEGFLYKLLSAIDTKNVNMAERVIVLSEDMKKTLSKRGCKTSQVRLVNNFVYEVVSMPEKSTTFEKNKVCFLFAGTLGQFQNLDLLLDAIGYFKGRPDVEFLFMGDGICRKSLEYRVQSNDLSNVFFLGQKPVHEAILAMKSSDYGIVSIAPKIAEVAYPSKTIMYLSNGLPIFAVVDQNTEIYQFINNESIGVAVAPTCGREIADAIEYAIQLSKKEEFSRTKISEVAENNFGMNITLNKFLKVFLECTE